VTAWWPDLRAWWADLTYCGNASDTPHAAPAPPAIWPAPTKRSPHRRVPSNWNTAELIAPSDQMIRHAGEMTYTSDGVICSSGCLTRHAWWCHRQRRSANP